MLMNQLRKALDAMPQPILQLFSKVEMIALLKDDFDIADKIDTLVYIEKMNAPMATDGKVIFVSNAILEYSPDEAYFILNHELDHINYKHIQIAKMNALNHELANLAQDLIINEELVANGLAMPHAGVTRANLSANAKKALVGKTSLEVYKELLDVAEQMKQNASDLMIQPNGDGQADDEQETGNGQGQSNKPLTEEQVKQALERLFGKEIAERLHKDLQEEVKQRQELQSRQITDDEREQIQKKAEKLADIITSSAGKQKSFIQQLEKNRYLPPVKPINWDEIFRRFIGTHIKKAYARTYSRPNRRIHVSGIIIPGYHGYTYVPKVVIYVDVSGSMSGTIAAVEKQLTLAKHILKSYDPNYYAFDTKIYKITSEKELSKYSGGGTIIQLVVDDWASKQGESDLAVIITDDQDTYSVDAIKKPLLIITNNMDKQPSNNPFVVIEKVSF